MSDNLIIRGSWRCPGCHSGDFPDFDHYMDVNHIPQEDAPTAFAAWLHAFSDGEWDGEAHCAHTHTDYGPPDPSVGQREYLVCEDCGRDLTDRLAEMREADEEDRAERLAERRLW